MIVYLDDSLFRKNKLLLIAKWERSVNVKVNAAQLL